VKSGYRLGRSVANSPSSSNFVRLVAWWNALWKLSIPLKIKFFIWKACYDWIPSLSNLARRGLHVVDCCPFCNRFGETTVHALWGCHKLKAAKVGWLPVGVQLSSEYSNFFDLILDCHSMLNLDDLGLFCTITWKVWYLRNLVVYQSPLQNVLDVVFWCKDFLADFRSCDLALAVPLLPVCNVRNSWRPPNSSCYKINCDAAVSDLEGWVGLGVVIRDHTGFVMASCSLPLIASFDVQAAEVMAVLRGLIFSRDCGLAPCMLETDAAVVVKWINDGSHLDSPCGNVLAEISSLISSLNIIYVSFVPRLANNVAHGLAKNALKVVKNFLLVGGLPSLYSVSSDVG
jgi:ribonuclease HI